VTDTPTPEKKSRFAFLEEPGGRMSFLEHLYDLRTRIVHSLLGIAIGMFVGLSISKYVIGFIIRPMLAALRSAHLEDHLIYTSPTGYISLIITLGVYIGLVIASPWVLYQVWLFVAPGLYKHERSAVVKFLFSSVFLFLCGIAFGYFIMLPYMLKFLIGLGSQGPIQPLISIDEYFSLILVVLLGLGVVFEMPVVIFFLALFNLVTPKFLWKNFRYAVLIITVVAAIITPTPDATTMLVFMAPMFLLYFLGIGVAAVVVRNKRRAQTIADSGTS
jgi:sec-independent protein translocase protein TatC